MPHWTNESTWIAEERTWAAPDSDLPHALLNEHGAVVAWVRSPKDAEAIAHARSAWPNIRALAVRTIASGDQTQAALVDHAAKLEELQRRAATEGAALATLQATLAGVERHTATLREQLQAERRAVEILARTLARKSTEP